VEDMKVFRRSIGTFLVLIITGSIGSLEWNLMGTSGNMIGMNMIPGFSIGTINIDTILYIIIAVLVFSFVIAQFGAVKSAFSTTR
jgi:hypothetical protein